LKGDALAGGFPVEPLPGFVLRSSADQVLEQLADDLAAICGTPALPCGAATSHTLDRCLIRR
jgi:hypothetical protein